MPSQNLTQKIISQHLVDGTMTAGQPISIRIDQTLTQDSTGTMAYLQFESMGIQRVRTELSVAYIDHNTLQSGFENADDHAYIQSVALRAGIRVSKAGNGICHQVHLERFGRPGRTLLGSDSHTPTAGGMGMLAIGAGGLDVAVAMGGGPLHLQMPQVTQVQLVGQLTHNTTAKDIILEVLRRLSVKGGVGRVMEYTGEGVASLSVPERATITNMGAELGATSSIFPSDEQTRAFLRAQGRESDFEPLCADEGAQYDQSITIDLSQLRPMVAMPHSPDNVAPVSQIAGLAVDQVCIGSCTNSSLLDLLGVASVLEGKRVCPSVSLVISPGSRQVLTMLTQLGALQTLLDAGARVIECACGPCIGMGQSPRGGGAVSLRTFNRNFRARSGTEDAWVYLVSPLTAAFSALAGVIVDPADQPVVEVSVPTTFHINDNLILDPSEFDDVQVVRGSNIQPFPTTRPLPDTLQGTVLLRAGDNVTTDDIMPSNARLLPYRSNIPYLADWCMSTIDPEFASRARQAGGGFVVAGTNYGQGSSREHAALVPLYLGVRAVLALSFARIHRDNLLNNGILPLVLDAADRDAIAAGDQLTLPDVAQRIRTGQPILVLNQTRNTQLMATLELDQRMRQIVIAGGVLASLK